MAATPEDQWLANLEPSVRSRFCRNYCQKRDLYKLKLLFPLEPNIAAELIMSLNENPIKLRKILNRKKKGILKADDMLAYYPKGKDRTVQLCFFNIRGCTVLLNKYAIYTMTARSRRSQSAIDKRASRLGLITEPISGISIKKDPKAKRIDKEDDNDVAK